MRVGGLRRGGDSVKSYRRMRKWTREMRCDYWTSLRDVCGFKVKSKGVVLFVFSCSHINIGSYGMDEELDWIRIGFAGCIPTTVKMKIVLFFFFFPHERYVGKADSSKEYQILVRIRRWWRDCVNWALGCRTFSWWRVMGSRGHSVSFKKFVYLLLTVLGLQSLCAGFL